MLPKPFLKQISAAKKQGVSIPNDPMTSGNVLTFDAQGNVIDTGVRYDGPQTTPMHSADSNLGVYASGPSAQDLAQTNMAIDQINNQIGRLDPQLEIALGNIGKQYSQKSNELTSSFNRGESQYNTSTTQNAQDKRTNINNIADRSSSGLRNLVNKLGAMGAVGTDLNLAGRAVQDEANQLRSGANQTFGKNQQTLDTNWNNFKEDVEQERKTLNDWRDTQDNSARQQVQTTRQNLLGQLAQLRNNQGNTGAAQAALGQANALSSEIDNLGRLNPTYTGQRINYTPQTLDNYTMGGGNTKVSVAQPQQYGADPTVVMRDETDDERKKQLY